MNHKKGNTKRLCFFTFVFFWHEADPSANSAALSLQISDGMFCSNNLFRTKFRSLDFNLEI